MQAAFDLRRASVRTRAIRGRRLALLAGAAATVLVAQGLSGADAATPPSGSVTSTTPTTTRSR
jgi:hypothetical protein